MSRTTALAVANPTLTNRRRRPSFWGLLYLAPFLILLTAFLIWPTVYGFYLSFTNRNLASSAAEAFVGFANYAEALTDPLVWRTLGNTATFTVASTIPLVVVALVMALLVNTKVRGKWLWRLSFFMPYLLASTVVSLIWVWLLNPDLGAVNSVLGLFGIPGPTWLQDPSFAMAGVVIATVWWTVGFNFLLYTSALQNIPDQVYEAASVDGASGWRQIRSITIPLLGRTTALVITLQILASLKVFDQIYQMTGGGPNNSTRSILEYVYDSGFSNYRLGYGSAISYIFFAIIIILTVVQFQIFSRRAER